MKYDFFLFYCLQILDLKHLFHTFEIHMSTTDNSFFFIDINKHWLKQLQDNIWVGLKKNQIFFVVDTCRLYSFHFVLIVFEIMV